jgi:hypothetical protein
MRTALEGKRRGPGGDVKRGKCSHEETAAALRSAVEMPGPRKTWKTKLRFPTFPTAPWKSPQARFPHSHRADDGSLFSETQKPRSSAKSVGKVGRMGGYCFVDDHAAAGRSCLRPSDLDRHQVRVQCPFQRGEPEDPHDDRPQRPDFTQGPRGCGKPKANWFRKKDSGRGLRLSQNMRVINGLANRPEVLTGGPTHEFPRPGKNQGTTARALRTLAPYHERRIHPRQRATVFHSSGSFRAWHQRPISGSCPE